MRRKAEAFPIVSGNEATEEEEGEASSHSPCSSEAAFPPLALLAPLLLGGKAMGLAGPSPR